MMMRVHLISSFVPQFWEWEWLPVAIELGYLDIPLHISTFHWLCNRPSFCIKDPLLERQFLFFWMDPDGCRPRRAGRGRARKEMEKEGYKEKWMWEQGWCLTEAVQQRASGRRKRQALKIEQMIWSSNPTSLGIRKNGKQGLREIFLYLYLQQTVI